MFHRWYYKDTSTEVETRPQKFQLLSSLNSAQAISECIIPILSLSYARYGI